MKASRLVIITMGVLLAALSAAIVVGSAHASMYSLMGDIVGRSSLERCYRRCEKNNPPIPSPDPTRTPRPEPTGQWVPFGGGQTSYEVGEVKQFYFDVKGDGPALVGVASTNYGNASCASMSMSCTSPAGETAYNYATQPGCTFLRKPGRYYVWTKLEAANDVAACHTYTFQVTK